MDEFRKRKPLEGNSAATESERRRIGLIVHDDRGMASLEWRDAPADTERTVLEVLDGPRLELKNDQSYDPYSRHTSTLPKLNSGGGTTRTDLRKLSEWIKMKRALEERKLRGDDDGDDQS